MKRAFGAYILILLLLPCASLQAHHNGRACLARDETITVVGEIVEIHFADPHVVLRIKTDQSIVVTAEWLSMWELSNGWGITSQILHPGERVVVRGSPYTCEDNRMSLITEVKRLEDDWTWSSRSVVP